jgi:peptidoglycan/xylan/chitin deacetylase (PgdA/CDA1 family)
MGSVVVSVDVALGWGIHDRLAPPPEGLEAAREGWETLLDLLAAYEVPATWALVGHLLLDECDGVHAGYPAPAGWFDCEREEWADRPDLRFAGDLFERLRTDETGHELACHSFSNVPFDAATTPRELAEAEVRAGLAVSRDHGFSPSTFVFPGDIVGYRDVLAAYDFICYRGAIHSRLGHSRVGRAITSLAAATPVVPRVVVPRLDEYGMVAIPVSLPLFGSVWGEAVVRGVRAGIRRAARGDGVFHVSLSPTDLTGPAEVDRLRDLLDAISEARRAHDLTVETMGAVGERVRWEPVALGQ